MLLLLFLALWKRRQREAFVLVAQVNDVEAVLHEIGQARFLPGLSRLRLGHGNGLTRVVVVVVSSSSSAPTAGMRTSRCGSGPTVLLVVLGG